jgi:hypothetical protein
MFLHVGMKNIGFVKLYFLLFCSLKSLLATFYSPMLFFAYRCKNHKFCQIITLLGFENPTGQL